MRCAQSDTRFLVCESCLASVSLFGMYSFSSSGYLMSDLKRSLKMKLLSLVLCLFSILSVSAQESKLWGQWKSDKKMTLKFLQSKVKLDENTEKSFNAMFAAPTTVTFHKDGTGQVDTPAYKLPLPDGTVKEMKALTQNFTYKILGETKDQVVIKGAFTFTDDTEFIKSFMQDNPYFIYVFIDENTCWSYTANGFTDLHAREYFKRITK